jgi:hypothetical protein
MLLVVLGAAAAIAAVIGYFVRQSSLAEQALAEAVAEADRLDPSWRLMELEANRKPVPPEQDSAAIIARTARSAWTIRNTANLSPSWNSAHEALETSHPTKPLTAQQTAALRDALGSVAPLVAAVRKVADLPRGRFPCNVRRELDWTIANIDYAGTTARLLQWDANVRLADDDGEGAWRNSVAVVNVGRSLGDEPLEFVQLRRGAIVAQGVRLMERTLAQREISAPALADAQRLLEDELQHPAFLIAVRGCRGVMDHSCTLLEAGQASLAQARRMAARTFGPVPLQDEVRGYFDRPMVKPAHAWLLRYLTQAAEIAKRPANEIEPALAELEHTLVDAPELARLLAPKVGQLHAFLHKRYGAQHRCAVAALAAERYRVSRNAWPDSLDDLVAAKLLTAVPVDPYDGKALRYRAMPDGVVVYSIGPDGRGKGESLDGHVPATGDNDARLEFRLWHVERRGQP